MLAQSDALELGADDAELEFLLIERIAVDRFRERGAAGVLLAGLVDVSVFLGEEVVDHEFLDNLPVWEIIPREFGELVGDGEIESRHLADLADRFGEIVNGRDEFAFKLLGRVDVSRGGRFQSVNS